MSNLQEFQFQTSAIRVHTDEHGNPLFCAKDVCDVLGYASFRDIIKKLCRPKGVSNRDTLTKGGQQSLIFIDEGNLYRLIIKSNKPEAEPFESWVCDEVLPTIRKTGGYPSPQLGKTLNAVLTAPITAFQKTLLLTLSHYANSNGQCQLSMGQLGSLLGVEKSTVCHAMGELRKAGYVDIIKTRYENGGCKPNTYIIDDRFRLGSSAKLPTVPLDVIMKKVRAQVEKELQGFLIADC